MKKGRDFSRPFPYALKPSTRNTLVIVLRAHTHEQFDRLRIGLRALHGAVGHVHRGLTAAVDLLHIGTLRHEIQNAPPIATRTAVLPSSSSAFTSTPTSSTRNFTAAIMPVGAKRCALPAKPSL